MKSLFNALALCAFAFSPDSQGRELIKISFRSGDTDIKEYKEVLIRVLNNKFHIPMEWVVENPINSVCEVLEAGDELAHFCLAENKKIVLIKPPSSHLREVVKKLDNLGKKSKGSKEASL